MNVSNLETDTSARPTRRQKQLVAAVCGLLFLMVYVLSVGPMVVLNELADFREFEGAIKILYAPLVFLIEQKIEPFASLLKWYVSLFS